MQADLETIGEDMELTESSRSGTDVSSSSTSLAVTKREIESASTSSDLTTMSASPVPEDGGASAEYGEAAALEAAELLRPGALTPAVLDCLLIKPPKTDDVNELTAELHMSAREGPKASRTLLHALSRESLDVLRAERIARRMAAAEEAAAASSRIRVERADPIVATMEAVEEMGAAGGSPTKRKQPKSQRAHRVYLPIVHSSPAGAATLMAVCEPADTSSL